MSMRSWTYGFDSISELVSYGCSSRWLIFYLAMVWPSDVTDIIRNHIITILFYITGGRRVNGISGSLIWSKTLMELVFNTCGEFRWSPDDPVSQIHFPYLHDEVPGIFSERVGCRKQREATAPIHPWQNCSLDSWFWSGRPAFGRTTSLVPEFAVEDLPLDRILMMMVIYFTIG